MHVLLHDDWEIYGDGTGDPQELMFNPANRLLEICDKYEAKYTFFAEVGQQLNMLNANSKKWNQIAIQWEETLKNAVKRGHDVQLHLHPQWIGAKLIDDKWDLDYSKWSCGNVEDELLEAWIRKGKGYLENLLTEVDQDFQIVCFRAGGWLCQPSNGLYKALKQNNICCDASVSKGRFIEYDDGGYVDSRKAVSRFQPWEVKPENFAEESSGSGVYELPVYAEESSLPQSAYLLKKSFRPFHYFNIFKRAKKNAPSQMYTPSVINSSDKSIYYGSFGYMHHKHLMSYIESVYSRSVEKDITPYIIYVTHSKDFLDYNNFETFLAKLSNRNDIEFSTTRKFVNNYVGH